MKTFKYLPNLFEISKIETSAHEIFKKSWGIRAKNKSRLRTVDTLSCMEAKFIKNVLKNPTRLHGVFSSSWLCKYKSLTQAKKVLYEINLPWMKVF